jgi:hypothetical protein
MPLSREERKIIETRALAAARKAGIPIPHGEGPGESPDFRFETEDGILGVEVSELLRPAPSRFGIKPVAEETYHKEIVLMAQALYDRAPNAKPAKLVLYFADARGKKRDKNQMAKALAEFVVANVDKANPVANCDGLGVPEGFGAMSIASEAGDWWCGECGGSSVADIRDALASGISEKNDLLPMYRDNLAPGAKVWLLLYSTVAVSRSMPIPFDIEEWRFDFDFDRVFWFTCLDNHFVEIERAEPTRE